LGQIESTIWRVITQKWYHRSRMYLSLMGIDAYNAMTDSPQFQRPSPYPDSPRHTASRPRCWPAAPPPPATRWRPRRRQSPLRNVGPFLPLPCIVRSCLAPAALRMSAVAGFPPFPRVMDWTSTRSARSCLTGECLFLGCLGSFATTESHKGSRLVQCWC
jgi:hypothetical protein